MNRIKCIDNLIHTPRLLWVSFLSFVVIILFAPTIAASAGAVAADSSTLISAPTATVKPKKPAVSKGVKKIQGKEKAQKTGGMESGAIFAIVNGKSIPQQAYDSQLAVIMRQRFYHGNIPEDQVDAVRKEITDELVDRELLVGEAKKRGMVPDPAKFDLALADYDVRYSADPAWAQQREQFLPLLKEQVDRSSLVEQMEKAIRDVPQPTAKEVRIFYDQKSELFTQPESPRLSVILLQVDPSSMLEVWGKASEEAKGIFERIKGGADFAEEARLHSAHASATNGGDMGYLHAGMLSTELEAQLGKLKIGEVSEPIRMLEGISLYRTEDRIPAKLQEFQVVEKRAQELLVRERVEKARADAIRRMRATAKVKILHSATPGVAEKSSKKK